MSRTKGSNIRRQEEYFSHIELGINPTLLNRDRLKKRGNIKTVAKQVSGRIIT